MAAFRLFLILVLIALVIYTGVTIYHHGLNLLPVFFGDIAKMAWPGQFNFDFMMFLALSALWTAWRNSFSAKGLGLGLLAFLGGMLFLSIYLLILTSKKDATILRVFLGDRGLA